MRRYRKKPVEVTAVQWTGSNEGAIRDVVGDDDVFQVVDPEDRGDDPEQTAAVRHPVHGTWMPVYDGQWIVRDAKGEVSAVTADVFAETYEPVPSMTWGTR